MKKLYFKVNRFFYIANEGWYAEMRDNKNIGPFESKKVAQNHINILQANALKEQSPNYDLRSKNSETK